MIVEFALNATLQRILVNVRSNSFSVTIDEATIYNFDAIGRLLGAYRGGKNYLRGLDNRVLVKWGGGHGLANRSRRDLSEDEKRAFFDEMQQTLLGIVQALRAGQITPIGERDCPPPQPFARVETHQDVTLLSWEEGSAVGDIWLHVADVLSSAWGYEQLCADGTRFRTIYKPVSILPPDQYLALVLQATEGCSWNKCTFCNFYRDRPFHIKGDDEFRQHIRAIRDFFGPALSLRTTVFLADANALVIPQERLLRLFDIVNAELPIVPARLSNGERKAWSAAHPTALRGVYSFVDAFTIRHKSVEDYHELAERNLRRAYIGLESGDDNLLRFLHKGNTAEDARQAVATIKAGGVDVGVILMLGVGGRRFYDAHVRHSIDVVNAMRLGERDILYFSPFFDYPGSEYARLAAELGIEPLTGQEMDAQMAAIRAGLRFADAQRRPKIAIYDIREFIY